MSNVTNPVPSDTQHDAAPVVMPSAGAQKLAAALRWAAMGIPVFPLEPNGKAPLPGSNGLDDATTDADTIREMWLCPMRGTARDFNIGARPVAGVHLFLDLDRKNGLDGIGEYEKLGGKVAGLVIATPSGGRHVIMTAPDTQNTAGKVAPGIDSRGSRGYCVAPGSTIDGVPYTVIMDGPMLPAPAFLLELIPARTDRVQTTTTRHFIENDSERNIERAARIALAHEPAVTGTWHEQGYKLGCELARCALSPEMAVVVAFEHWQPRGTGFMSSEQFERDILDGYRDAVRDGDHGVNSVDALELAFRGLRIIPESECAPPGESVADSEVDPWLTNLPSGLNGSNIVALSATDCANVPTPPYLIKGILAKGQMAAVAALPGSGKSCFAPLLAYRMSQGVTVFGHRTRPGRVAYFGLEDEHGMAGRITALQRKYGEAAEFRLFIRARNLLTCVEEQEEIKRMVRAGRPDLVVFDTVRAGWRGLSENDSDAMSAVVAFVRELTRGADGEAGPAVILIHHTTKSGGRTMAGSGVLEADADTTMFLEKDPETGVVEVSFGKNRNGESAGNEIYFRIEPVQITTDEDGDPVTRPIAVEEDARTVRREKGLSAAQAHALAILEGLVADTPPVVADLEMGGMFFGGARSVEREAWELACEVQQLSKAEKPADRTRAFRRAVTDLVRLKRVAPLGSNIFLLKQGVK